MKTLTKLAEENWDYFSNETKEWFWEELENFEEKFVKLKEGQKTAFGNGKSQDIEVCGLQIQFEEFQKKLREVCMNTKVEEKGLVVQSNVSLVAKEIPTAEWLETVKALHASGFFPDLRSVGQAIAKAQAGRELGLPPYYSLQHLYILPGKPPCLDAQAMGMLIKRSGNDYRIIKSDTNVCTIKFFGIKGEELGECSFTYEEAAKITQGGKPLVTKDVWRNYRSDMLFARCLSRGYRRFCPHLGVVYLREEIEIEEPIKVAESSALSDFKVENTTPAQIAEKVPVESPTQPSRKEIIEGWKATHGQERIIEVMKKNGFVKGEKLTECSDEKFKKIFDTLAELGKAVEKIEKAGLKKPKEKPKEMTREEKLEKNRELLKEFGKEKLAEVKEKLKIEGKVADLEQAKFEEYVNAVKA